MQATPHPAHPSTHPTHPPTRTHTHPRPRPPTHPSPGEAPTQRDMPLSAAHPTATHPKLLATSLRHPVTLLRKSNTHPEPVIPVRRTGHRAGHHQHIVRVVLQRKPCARSRHSMHSRIGASSRWEGSTRQAPMARYSIPCHSPLLPLSATSPAWHGSLKEGGGGENAHHRGRAAPHWTCRHS